MNAPDDSDHARAGIQSVEVGFGLLRALGEARGPLMLRDLAAAAAMSPAKAHRYLVSFQRLQLVVQEPASTRYDLGPAALQLGLAALSRLNPVQLARARVGAWVELLGHTVALAVWGNHGPTIVHWQESPQAVTVNLRLGDVMPLLRSATGRCFAAWTAPEALAPLLREELAWLQQLPPSAHTDDLPRTQSQARALLSEVRQRGLARVIDTLLPGVVGFCAPVFDASQHLVLGIVTLGSAATLDSAWDGATARQLKAVAKQLSTDLGGSA